MDLQSLSYKFKSYPSCFFLFVCSFVITSYMPTLLQLIRSQSKRCRKLHKSSVPLLAGCPQKKAMLNLYHEATSTGGHSTICLLEA